MSRSPSCRVYVFGFLLIVTVVVERGSVSPQSNRRLKDAIIGAAETVIKDQAEPFYSRFVTWSHNNLSRRNARRTLARALAVTLWGMWKTETNFDPARWAVTS